LTLAFAKGALGCLAVCGVTAMSVKPVLGSLWIERVDTYAIASPWFERFYERGEWFVFIGRWRLVWNPRPRR
jgi:hypothetical protein